MVHVLLTDRTRSNTIFVLPSFLHVRCKNHNFPQSSCKVNIHTNQKHAHDLHRKYGVHSRFRCISYSLCVCMSKTGFRLYIFFFLSSSLILLSFWLKYAQFIVMIAKEFQVSINCQVLFRMLTLQIFRQCKSSGTHSTTPISAMPSYS